MSKFHFELYQVFQERDFNSFFSQNFTTVYAFPSGIDRLLLCSHAVFLLSRGTSHS